MAQRRLSDGSNTKQLAAASDEVPETLEQPCRHRPMPVRGRAVRDGVPRVLGLARSQPRQPACAWRRVRDLRRHLAQALSHHGGGARDQPFRGEGNGRGAQLLSALRHAPDLRAHALAAHDQHSARALSEPHRPSADLPHRHRRDAGLGLRRRAAGSAQRLSRRVLEAIQEERSRYRMPVSQHRSGRVAHDHFFRRNREEVHDAGAARNHFSCHA